MQIWDELYASGHTMTPSPFAEFLASSITTSGTLIDLGCGNGRDSLYLASRGFDVIGLDVSGAAITAASTASEERGITCRFLCRDITRLAHVQQELVGEGEAVVYYGRFIFHSLDDYSMLMLMDQLGALIGGRDSIGYFEFRTKADETLKHVYEHSRFYRGVDEYSRLATDVALKLTVLAHGTGMAPYRDEDPVVCRARLESG
jgi:SAM-dependent methyltransferase